MTDRLSAEEIEELQRLLDAATPGEWAVCERPLNEYWKAGKTIGVAVPQGIRVCDTTELFPGKHDGIGADAALIITGFPLRRLVHLHKRGMLDFPG